MCVRVCVPCVLCADSRHLKYLPKNDGANREDDIRLLRQFAYIETELQSKIEPIACSHPRPTPDRIENRVNGKMDFNLKSKYVYNIFYMWFRLEII